RRVPVAAREVFAAHRRTVRGPPRETVLLHRPRYAAPQARVRDAGAGEKLRHLSAVSELVRQVADPHTAAQFSGSGQPALQVAYQVLTAAQELVGEHRPGPNRELAGAYQCSDPVGVLGAHLQVVV